jgi:hypothetical protein
MQLWEAQPQHTTYEFDPECIIPSPRTGLWQHDDDGGIPRGDVQLDNPLYEDERTDDAIVGDQDQGTFSRLARRMSTKRWFFDV